MRAKPERQITQEEIEAFHRDGAVLVKGVLSQEWIDLVAEGVDDAFFNPGGMSGGIPGLHIDQFPASRSTKLRRIIEESPVAEIVGSTLCSPVRFYMDQMFYKSEGKLTETAWHQDTCYYNIAGHDLIRAWLCPDPVPREASLEVIRGSQFWNVTYRPLVGRDPDEDPDARALLEAGEKSQEPLLGPEYHKDWSYDSSVMDKNLPATPDIEAHRDSFDILGWDFEPGDVILFHGHILHGAPGGVTLPHPRRAHASLWAGTDVRYLRRRGQIIPDPVALYEHKPKSGQPLSDFPDVFPVAWSPPESA